ncbi:MULTISPECIES: CTP--phosphocholine cytidylyltransferase [Clostridium]|uniref:Phosphocholine cytidylyltransferase involved in choline phosphorylation for cell surface LPS epitopes n=1 Tax=Clostridium saccharoperbutylacetonicum N1-4(HMT) TaxID=931276 RepID=M1M0M8_9CLOT|nr:MULTISPECIES: CTP--phosphocholine cytidylyltransferase [Clostridium]AGF59130.1 phosphocholine cytidylyltransferase involved in choline phosphorylation for cell surface LPS epitopes [Clostridium saccharoperbutylacetonicum N1-4(HMT)]AQR97799.1 bifunctional IPC transferase and DIPP synthase [Clostridium saccharoperbutylacetonicum]NRT60082.1 CTP:phosphocholine cytidylyltransferase-like protein [Clostridium saccharoperbutylacetonicum]NSB23394.1 CTP:phosphocholine cytidylyltransferase-like protein
MRAILMAAGMGTRLRPLTENTPKSLIEVNGMSLLERQILNLRECGINEIIVLTGYLHEKFDDIVKKYNLIKVVNEKFDVYNNIYTMYLVRQYLNDAFVIDADNYITKNFLPKAKPTTSIYYSACKENIVGEWILKYDDNGRIFGVDIGKEGDEPKYIMSGASFWTEKDGELIAKKVEEAVDKGDFRDLYWDSIAVDNLKNMNVYIEKIESDDIFEIDSLQDLEYLKRTLNL